MSEKLEKMIAKLDEMLRDENVIIEATSRELLLIRDMESGDERILDHLGYPI